MKNIDVKIGELLGMAILVILLPLIMILMLLELFGVVEYQEEDS